MKKIKRTLSVLLSSLMLLPTLSATGATVSAETATAGAGQFVGSTYTYENTTIGTSLYVPKTYSDDKEYALLIHLHNAGLRNEGPLYTSGTGNSLTTKIINNYGDEFIMFVPRCPVAPRMWVEQPWRPGTYRYEGSTISPALNAVVSYIYDEIIANYNIDMSRVYIAGDSMGGGGTWDLILREPNLFAAAFPVAGYCDPTQAANINEDIAIWAAHTAQDKEVKVIGDRAMIATLKNLGRTNVKYTEYDSSIPEVKNKFSAWTYSTNWEHYAWEPAHNDMEMIKWLVSQKREPRLAPELGSKFADIAETDTYYKAVNYVTDEGLFMGVSDTEFGPTQTMTRAMFVTVLGRYANVDTTQYTGVSFSDIDTVYGTWYAPYVDWATKNGIIEGMGNGTFGVDKAVTIEQACTILGRFLEYKAAPNDTQLTLDYYDDNAVINDWAKDSMDWAISNSVYMGKLGNSRTLLPRNPASRSVIATMFYNITMIYGR